MWKLSMIRSFPSSCARNGENGVSRCRLNEGETAVSDVKHGVGYHVFCIVIFVVRDGNGR
jgi:hypothetical protein